MRRRPPISTRTDTLFPYTTLFRSCLIDTPGMRELKPTGEEGVAESFNDIEALAEQCRFRDCRHAKEPGCAVRAAIEARSEEHTSELQSLMRISYAVFCLKKKTAQ